MAAAFDPYGRKKQARSSSRPDPLLEEKLLDRQAERAQASNKGAGAKNAAAFADPTGAGGVSNAFVGLVVVTFVLACIGAAGFGVGMASLTNDDDLRDSLNTFWPLLDFAFNYTTAGVATSQSYCSGSFTHIAYGDPATGNITLDKRRSLKTTTREVSGENHARGENRKKATQFTARGFPVDATILPGVSGVVSIVRVGHTVQITIAATGLPNDWSDPTPIWEAPDTVRMLASYLPYECIPPIASWPNCNDTIDNVAPCSVLSDDFEHPVFFGPFGRLAKINAHHTQITNGAAWWLDGDSVAITGGYIANAFAEFGTDSESDFTTDYLIGMQSFIWPTNDVPFDTVDTDLFFDQIHAQFVYKTDAAFTWTVPEECEAACL